MNKLSALLSLIVLCTPSCFIARTTTNEPLQRELLDRLRPGTSTASEVVELLGAPSEVIQLGSRSAYRYDYSALKRAALYLFLVAFFNEDTRSDRAWLFFDAHDVLTHVGITLQGEDARYAMPWQKIHDE